MASIDKTYTNSYKEYQEFKDWLGVNNYKNYSNGWANLFTKVMSEKELLEKFKKEKGL